MDNNLFRGDHPEKKDDASNQRFGNDTKHSAPNQHTMQNLQQLTLVCLPRRIQALEWWKINHPSYFKIFIGDNFIFSKDAVTYQSGIVTTPTALQLEQLLKLAYTSPTDPGLIRYLTFDEQVLHEMNSKTAGDTEIERYEHRYLQKPFLIDTNDLDLKVFSWNFPMGQNGFNQLRSKPNTPREMHKFHLSACVRRFATDLNALSFAQEYCDQKEMLSALGLRTRMTGRQVAQGDLQRIAANKLVDDYSKIWTASRTFRGHTAYGDQVKHELRAHIAIFGAPTWFVTLSPNEKDWKEILQIYHAVQPQKSITRETIYEASADDPFFFERHFQNRKSAVLNKLLLQKNGPLGNICHYFLRVEYQQRGTQHMHGLLWDRDAPGADATDEERLAYITKHVTARLPDESAEPDLFAIIHNLQRPFEKHSRNCMRTYKMNNELRQHCRFNFPRPVDEKDER